MNRSAAASTATLTLGVLGSAAWFVVPTGTVQELVYAAVALTSVLSITLGVRRHRPRSPQGWTLIASSITAWLLGGALHGVMDATGKDALWVAADSAYLCALLTATAAALSLARSRTERRQTGAALDSLIIAVGVSLLTWVFLVGPALAAARDAPGRFAAVAFPLGVAAVLGALVRLAKAPGPGRRVSQLAAWVVGGSFLAQGIVQATADAHVDTHPSTLDGRWLGILVVAGALAQHPWMRELTARAEPGPERLGAASLVGLAGALAVGPVILAGQLLAGAPLTPWPVIVASLVLGGLVGLRMLWMVRAVDIQATTDHLTGLPNRRALYRSAGSVLAVTGTQHALLMLDLDRFKEVNDGLGHHAGDAMLVQVGKRLEARVRPQDVLARLGGDEFALLMPDVGHAEASRIASTLAEVLRAPHVLDGIEVHADVSIGIALSPEHGTDLSSLLRAADIALYRSKHEGSPVVFSGGLDASRRLRLVEELRAGIAGDQLVLHYQPKVDLRTGAVDSVEALVRWQHPEQGLLPPGQFLQLATASGLLLELTEVVLRLALDQAQRWSAAGRSLPIAVNLAVTSLTETGLPDRLDRMLATRGLPPSSLRIEITEEFLMADRVRATAVLHRLREAGIRIAVDDFGTGYSSLAYLRELPLDELKIDRSFIVPMAHDPRARALVSSAIALAHSLDLRMVAEGVEDTATYEDLARLGCDEVQGYVVARPQSAGDLEAWLDARVAVPAAL